MARPTFLSFANVTAAAALVIATTGGGFAVAAGLGKNVVGSPQIKKSAVKSSDVKNDGLLGKDIRESTLGTVPSAAKAATATTATTAGKAASVATVVTDRVTAGAGKDVVFNAKGTFDMLLRCIQDPVDPTKLDAQVVIRTKADNAALSTFGDGAVDGDMDVVESYVVAESGQSTVPLLEDGGFTALSAAGVSWKGFGYAVAHPNGTQTCSAEMTFLG